MVKFTQNRFGLYLLTFNSWKPDPIYFSWLVCCCRAHVAEQTYTSCSYPAKHYGICSSGRDSLCPNWGRSLEHKKTQMQLFGSMQFLTSKVYLYITTVQSESLACKIGVLHIYNRYTIIYYHNKTKANKKKTREQPFLNTLSFLQFSQHFYKTRRTDSHYYYHHHHHRHF